MSDKASDPGLPPEPHPVLARTIDAVEQMLVSIARARLTPSEDAALRFQLAQWERFGVYAPNLLPARAATVCQNMMFVVAALMKSQPANEILAHMKTIFLAARVVALAYEQASQPGVLRAMQKIEMCYDSQGGELFLSASEYELREATLELVAALRMQDRPSDD